MFRRIVFSMLVFTNFFSCTTEDDNNPTPTDPRENYLGVWMVTESCSKDAYEATIVKDESNSSQVIIKNFWNIGMDEKAPYAIVTESTLVIPNQAMCNDGSLEVSGSGSYTKTGISWTYQVKNTSTLWQCQATYTH
jgi:hypothetical protein